MVVRESTKWEKGDPTCLEETKDGGETPGNSKGTLKISLYVWGNRGKGNHITGGSVDLGEKLRRGGSGRTVS